MLYEKLCEHTDYLVQFKKHQYWYSKLFFLVFTRILEEQLSGTSGIPIATNDSKTETTVIPTLSPCKSFSAKPKLIA